MPLSDEGCNVKAQVRTHHGSAAPERIMTSTSCKLLENPTPVLDEPPPRAALPLSAFELLALPSLSICCIDPRIHPRVHPS